MLPSPPQAAFGYLPCTHLAADPLQQTAVAAIMPPSARQANEHPVTKDSLSGALLSLPPSGLCVSTLRSIFARTPKSGPRENDHVDLTGRQKGVVGKCRSWHNQQSEE